MKRIPPYALATALVAMFCFSIGCSPKKADGDDSDTAAEPEALARLDNEAAAESFLLKVESKLDILRIADRTAAAVIRPTEKSAPLEMVYIFPGLGSSVPAGSIVTKLGNKWEYSDERACWLPWEKLADIGAGDREIRPGPFLGRYDAEGFVLSVWIDSLGTTLLISYAEKPAAE